MKIIRVNELSHQEIIAQAIEVLRAGGLVVFPTETTYGLGADATNPIAINALLAYKTKRSGKALSIMVADEAMASEYVDLNDTAKSIYHKFLPGPVTVVSVGKHKVAPEVESAQGSLGVRISSYDLTREIVAQFGKPITATSANPSGGRRPYKIADIVDNISLHQQNLIDLIIDAGELPHNEPSTVIDTTLDSYRVLRQGELQFAQQNRAMSHSEEDTITVGSDLITKYRNDLGQRAVIIALEGDLGAGKTRFVKGLAQGLGITDLIRSPSYTLVHEHNFHAEGQTLKLIHIDAWRLEQADELINLGLEQFVSEKSVIALEWAGGEIASLQKFINRARLIWVKISYAAGENERLITWSDEVKIS